MLRLKLNTDSTHWEQTHRIDLELSFQNVLEKTYGQTADQPSWKKQNKDIKTSREVQDNDY